MNNLKKMLLSLLFTAFGIINGNGYVISHILHGKNYNTEIFIDLNGYKDNIEIYNDIMNNLLNFEKNYLIDNSTIQFFLAKKKWWKQNVMINNKEIDPNFNYSKNQYNSFVIKFTIIPNSDVNYNKNLYSSLDNFFKSTFSISKNLSNIYRNMMFNILKLQNINFITN